MGVRKYDVNQDGTRLDQQVRPRMPEPREALIVSPREARRIRVPKASELVADVLRRRIVKRQLKAGDVLPPEAELIAQLNVARGTLREAIRMLESESLVTTTRGSAGVRVCVPDSSAVSRLAGVVLQYEGATLADLYASQLAIEPAAVRQLATRRSPEAIAELTAIAEQVEQIQDPDEHAMASTIFHQRLVELSGSRTLALFARITGDIARARVRTVTERGRPHPSGSDPTHRRALELIAAGDVDEAVSFWQAHVQEYMVRIGEEADNQQVIDLYGD